MAAKTLSILTENIYNAFYRSSLMRMTLLIHILHYFPSFYDFLHHYIKISLFYPSQVLLIMNPHQKGGFLLLFIFYTLQSMLPRTEIIYYLTFCTFFYNRYKSHQQQKHTTQEKSHKQHKD
jgi:hypothetical protein